MRSFRELDATGIRGLVFDIDDTVTRLGIVEPEAFSAIHALSAHDFVLVAVTGRPLGWTDVLAHLWPVELAVGENGAGWACRNGRAVRQGYFSDAPARREQQLILSRVRIEVSQSLPEVRVARDQGLRRCDLAFDVGEEASLSESQIEALVRIIEGNGARSSVSTVPAHAIPGPWDKATGVARALADTRGVRLENELDRWVFVGDSGNDAAAFDFFPLSVGVANIEEHLGRIPNPPRFVTDADRGRGFAELADHLLQSRA